MRTRSNQEWLDQLRGDDGEAQQGQAFEALATYLYHKAYDYLKERQGKRNPWRLVNLADEDVAALAQDAVQHTLEKLARDEFALLAGFRQEGSFTSWMRTIVINETKQKLREPHLNRGVWWSLSEEPSQVADKLQQMSAKDSWSVDPEKWVMQQEVITALEKCLSQLDPELRQIFWGRVVDKQPAKALAATFKRSSVDEVYWAVRRAKRHLQRCLKKSEHNRELFELFQ